jgi:hypothetical protein
MNNKRLEATSRLLCHEMGMHRNDHREADKRTDQLDHPRSRGTDQFQEDFRDIDDSENIGQVLYVENDFLLRTSTLVPSDTWALCSAIGRSSRKHFLLFLLILRSRCGRHAIEGVSDPPSFGVLHHAKPLDL